jgi:hypothetical protein
VIKHNFDQTPVLLENFDQVIRSSAIRSSDPLSPHNVNVIILPKLKCTKNEIQVQPNVFQFNK